MSTIDEETVNSTNDTTEEVANTEEVEDTGAESETEDAPKFTESEMKSYARMKKAEAEARQLKKELDALKVKPEVKKTEPSKKQDEFTLEDVAVLVSKVSHKEDRETVKKYANLEGISLEDAMANPIVKGILAERAEQRQTAEATNTSNARRGTTKLSDEQILANAEKGKFPDDPEVLAEARMSAKKNKK